MADYAISASFYIIGAFWPAELTAFLGIMPATTRPKGTILRSGQTLDYSEWTIRSRLVEDAVGWPAAVDDPVQRHLRDILAQLAPAWEHLRELAREDTMGFVVFVRRYTEHWPLLEIQPDILARIADIGAQIQFDLYAADWERFTSPD